MQDRHCDELWHYAQNCGHGTHEKSSSTWSSSQSNSHLWLEALYTESFGQSPHTSGFEDSTMNGWFQVHFPTTGDAFGFSHDIQPDYSVFEHVRQS